SAHFWLGTAAGRTFIASPMCEVGSVGIMLTYQSFKECFRKQGIDYREIYPDSADLKNYETRAIEDDNNEEPIKQRLAVMHRIFCDAISRNLGIAYDPELPLFRGQIFTGDV
ncbi:S49 family peptidase, partial [Bacteroides thetaiotaomicron]